MVQVPQVVDRMVVEQRPRAAAKAQHSWEAQPDWVYMVYMKEMSIVAAVGYMVVMVGHRAAVVADNYYPYMTAAAE